LYNETCVTGSWVALPSFAEPVTVGPFGLREVFGSEVCPKAAIEKRQAEKAIGREGSKGKLLSIALI
jgi:hypothetical protein